MWLINTNSCIQSAMKNYFLASKSEFDDECAFVKFEHDGLLYHPDTTSATLFGRIEYTKNGAEHRSADYFLKMTISQLLDSDWDTFKFANEIHFYTKVRAFWETFKKVDFLATLRTSHLQLDNNNIHAIIAFENLGSYGFVRCRQKPFLDYDHAALMMETLGKFHAYSYKAKRENPNRFHSLIECGSNFVSVRRKRMAADFVECWHDVLRPFKNEPRYSAVTLRVEKMLEDISQVVELANGTRKDESFVLAHGNYFLRNALFRYEGVQPVDMRIVDFQTWSLAPAAIDIFAVLYANCNQRLRTRHWDDLIDVYFASLNRTFANVPIPTKASVQKELEQCAPFVLYLATERHLDLESTSPDDQLEYTFDGKDICIEKLTEIFKDLANRFFC